jgi:hypothetical protein
MKYRIVYPQGDRKKLSIAHVVDCEEDDWDLASHREFSYTEEGKERASAYLIELATKYNLEFRLDQHYLD